VDCKMTEFWVSQAKHWCRVCKVWTGGHKSQIAKHNEGVKHIENEKNNLIRMKKDEQSKLKEEESVKKQLAEIERAAAAAMARQFAPETAPPEDEEVQKMRDMQAFQRNMEKRKIELVVEAATKRARGMEGQGSWTKHTDPTSKVNYYYNSVTKESSWETPPGFVDAAPTAAPAATASGAEGQGSWTKHTDPTSKVNYYYNAVTKESRWQPPPGFIDAAPTIPPSVPAATKAPASVPVMIPFPNTNYAKAPPPPQRQQQHSAGFSKAGFAGAVPNVVPPSVQAVGSTAVPHILPVIDSIPTIDPASVPVMIPAPTKPPPPPPRQQQGGSSSSVANAAEAMPGGWEEVAPEDSMFGREEEVAAAEEADDDDAEAAEDGIVGSLAELKAEEGRSGIMNFADREVKDKETYTKRSMALPADGGVSFTMRKRASGIRKQEGAAL